MTRPQRPSPRGCHRCSWQLRKSEPRELKKLENSKMSVLRVLMTKGPFKNTPPGLGPRDTVFFGRTLFLQRRCLATPFFFLLLYVPPGFLRGGHVTHHLSSLPGFAFFFCNQLAFDRLVIRRAVEIATPWSVGLFVIIGTLNRFRYSLFISHEIQ